VLIRPDFRATLTIEKATHPLPRAFLDAIASGRRVPSSDQGGRSQTATSIVKSRTRELTYISARLQSSQKQYFLPTLLVLPLGNSFRKTYSFERSRREEPDRYFDCQKSHEGTHLHISTSSKLPKAVFFAHSARAQRLPLGNSFRKTYFFERSRREEPDRYFNRQKSHERTHLISARLQSSQKQYFLLSLLVLP
jgi:hypothetical protein